LQTVLVVRFYLHNLHTFKSHY